METSCENKTAYFVDHVPEALVNFFLVYWCAICIIGTMCNVAALWCVVRCPRTIPPVKVIQGAIFSSKLLLCLVDVPLKVHIFLKVVWCNKDTYTRIVAARYIITGSVMTMEFFYIFVLALLRALAVWKPMQGPVKLRTAVGVVAGVALYSISLQTIRYLLFVKEVIPDPYNVVVMAVYFLVHRLLPVVLTLACYLSTVVAVRRNKRNLPAGQRTRVLDEATRSMLAVFIAQLLLVLPLSIHDIVKQFIPTDKYLILRILVVSSVYYSNLFVEPTVFVCFNKHHRKRILQALQLFRCRSRRQEDALSYLAGATTLTQTRMTD